MLNFESVQDVIRHRHSLFVYDLCFLEETHESVVILIEDAFRFFQRRKCRRYLECGVGLNLNPRPESDVTNLNRLCVEPGEEVFEKLFRNVGSTMKIAAGLAFC
jgi:hypothetical protein